jgi:uncharacterized protein
MHVVELEFDADQERRLKARPEHRLRLLELHAQGHLVLAGPWPDESGALLIFNADRPRVDELLAEDPYYATPGVHVKSVREWNPLNLVQRNPAG